MHIINQTKQKDKPELLCNLGKRYLLSLAALCISEANLQPDEKLLSYARKVRIITTIALE